MPSSKEKRGGERQERRRRGRREMGRFFDPGRYLQGNAEQLSISDQWLSFESSLFKAVFGSRVRWASLNKLAPGQHPRCCVLINVCQIWKTSIFDESWIEIQKKRERKNKWAAENQTYHRIKYWKISSSRRQKRRAKKKMLKKRISRASVLK